MIVVGSPRAAGTRAGLIQIAAKSFGIALPASAGPCVTPGETLRFIRSTEGIAIPIFVPHLTSVGTDERPEASGFLPASGILQPSIAAPVGSGARSSTSGR